MEVGHMLFIVVMDLCVSEHGCVRYVMCVVVVVCIMFLLIGNSRCVVAKTPRPTHPIICWQSQSMTKLLLHGSHIAIQ